MHGYIERGGKAEVGTKTNTRAVCALCVLFCDGQNRDHREKKGGWDKTAIYTHTHNIHVGGGPAALPPPKYPPNPLQKENLCM